MYSAACNSHRERATREEHSLLFYHSKVRYVQLPLWLLQLCCMPDKLAYHINHDGEDSKLFNYFSNSFLDLINV